MAAAGLGGHGSEAVTCQHAVEDAYAEACCHQLLPQALSRFRLPHLQRWLSSYSRPSTCSKHMPEGHIRLLTHSIHSMRRRLKQHLAREEAITALHPARHLFNKSLSIVAGVRTRT